MSDPFGGIAKTLPPRDAAQQVLVERAQTLAERLHDIETVLDDIDNGVHATTGRQFGQGMAHAAKLVRAALVGDI